MPPSHKVRPRARGIAVHGRAIGMVVEWVGGRVWRAVGRVGGTGGWPDGAEQAIGLQSARQSQTCGLPPCSVDELVGPARSGPGAGASGRGQAGQGGVGANRAWGGTWNARPTGQKAGCPCYGLL
jgi:hypothetical protein